MAYEIAIKSDQVLVTVKNTLNVKVADDLFMDLQGLIDAGERHIVVDMKNTEYIDSTGLGVFSELKHILDEKNGTIKAINVQDYCYEAFDSAHMVEEFLEEQ